MGKENIKKEYRVEGMTCASCANSVETYLKPLEGVSDVSVNYPNHSATITFSPDLISEQELADKTSEIGYKLIINSESSSETEGHEKKRLTEIRNKLLVSAIFSIPVFVISMFFMGQIKGQNWILLALATPAFVYGGSEFFVTAWKRLKHFKTNMDTLVAISTGAAFAFSLFNTIYPEFLRSRGIEPHVYYESAVIIITLILLGRYLEERAKRKTSSAIRELMSLRPDNVTVVRNGEEKEISLDDIIVGDLLIIKPGDKIPVDGKVKRGESYIDESMITGEPVPVKKEKGDEVFAGTINKNGSLKVLAKKVGSETMLSNIIRLVKEAQSTKPNIQKLADKVSGIFVPAVIILSVITFAIWWVLGPAPSSIFAFNAFITVLIIACPCALGLATPTALMVGIGKGAKQGILIRDAQVLETAHSIDVLILDKTGTITEGKPVVTDLHWIGDESTKDILYALENASEHPLADAVVQHLDLETKTEVDGFESITGKGVTGKSRGTNYFVGNLKVLPDSVSINDEVKDKVDQLKREAKTVIYFASSDEIIAVIAISDKIKETSRKAIDSLHKLGIELHMLTGDNEETAAHVAKEVGLDSYQAQVLPEEKGNFVKELQSQGKIIAMVGDGINDSHALAQADIGIAMGSGSDVAMDSAGITLMHSDLNQVYKAIKLSQLTIKTIRQNLFWAFVYNIIAIPIAAGALYPAFGYLLNPMIGGAAMSMSSVSVLMNSLFLKRKKL